MVKSKVISEALGRLKKAKKDLKENPYPDSVLNNLNETIDVLIMLLEHDKA